MARVNWAPDEGKGVVPDGIYALSVKGAKEMHSSNGDPMFIVTYRFNDTPGEVQDVMMLDGKGRGIAHQKFKALGFVGNETDIQPGELLTRRVIGAVMTRERTFEKKDGTSATIKENVINIAGGGMCGLWPITNPPEGFVVPEDDGSPF